MLNDLIYKLSQKRDKAKALKAQTYFKTGKGDYAEGDIFWGVFTPELRKLALEFKNLSLKDLKKLIKNPVNEKRQLALFVLINQFERGDTKKKKELVDFYLDNLDWVNNWNLVDSSAPKILGQYLTNKSTQILYTLVKSDNLWSRRIAIVSTLEFIKHGKFDDSLKLAKKLLSDDQDLIHKAVGWVLREVGKKDLELEEKFLKKHSHHMPRVTLRYAIERFDKNKRQEYLKINK